MKFKKKKTTHHKFKDEHIFCHHQTLWNAALHTQNKMVLTRCARLCFLHCPLESGHNVPHTSHSGTEFAQWLEE